MSEKHFRMRSARIEQKPRPVCVVSFEFDHSHLPKPHLGHICEKLDAAFLELLLEHGYQVPVEPPAPAAKPGFKGPDFEEQGLFDENGGV